jgi:aminoglycoside phosphotransferase family enzyme/predicted kinase
MKDPLSYQHPVDVIQNIQTHISSVYLTGKYVYKIKKAINFGFLDFSTLSKRKKYCEEEIILNKRISPELYLEVVPIVKSKENKIQVNGKGQIVEYAVKMIQFPQKTMMSYLLQKNQVTKNHIDSIVEILISFYKNQKSSLEILSYGKKENIEKNIMENFQQTTSYIGRTIENKQYDRIKKFNEFFLKNSNELFNDRMEENYIKSCHGDLHSGNIIIWNDEIKIFDCIEFNKRFQYIDTASDIGFLAMDLDFLNKPFLSCYLIDKFQSNYGDNSILNILNFYKSYRAYVRGKVEGFRLDDFGIPQNLKDKILHKTKRYYLLSEYYITLCYLNLQKKHPLLFLICGLTGSGKSTLSLKLSIDYHADIVSTDIIRKKIEGIDYYERHHDKPDTGLYASDKREKTYTEVLNISHELLKRKRNVIIDATFQKNSHRKMVIDLARSANATLVMIQCVSTDKLVKKWLDERRKTNSISDGRWEIYQLQKDLFEPFEAEEQVIVIDMSKDNFKDYFRGFQTILHTIMKLEDL